MIIIIIDIFFVISKATEVLRINFEVLSNLI